MTAPSDPPDEHARDAAPAPAGGESAGPTPVAVCTDRAEADAVRDVLLRAGIDATVARQAHGAHKDANARKSPDPRGAGHRDREPRFVVLVDAADAPPARQVLQAARAAHPARRRGDGGSDEQPLDSPADEPDDELDAGDFDETELTTDDLAVSAWRAAKFSCIFPPALLLTGLLIARAAGAARLEPPADPEAFRRRLRMAVLLGVLIPAGLIVGVVLLAAPPRR